MKAVSLQMDEAALRFYRGIADAAGLPLETVLADALFKLAGELSLEAISRTCGDGDSLLY